MLEQSAHAAASASAAARAAAADDSDEAGPSGLQAPVRRKRGRPRGPSRGRALSLSMSQTRRQRLADSQRATPPARNELPDLTDVDDDSDDEVVFNHNVTH